MKDNQRKAMFAKMGNNKNKFVDHERNIKQLNIKSNRLPVQVAVIVPSTKENDKPLTDKEFKARVTREQAYFNKQFGGSSSTRGEGSYSLGGRVIKERVVLVSSSTTKKQYADKRKALSKHFMSRQKQWKQNSILVKVEGEDFVLPRKGFIKNEKQLPDDVLVS